MPFGEASSSVLAPVKAGDDSRWGAFYEAGHEIGPDWGTSGTRDRKDGRLGPESACKDWSISGHRPPKGSMALMSRCLLRLETRFLTSWGKRDSTRRPETSTAASGSASPQFSGVKRMMVHDPKFGSAGVPLW